jgi:CheY-like chemotaxis protein
VSNLLLITDVARLRKIFSRLTEDKNIRLRVVNNLEKGGEEIALEKPDAVFVQTHLSGLSADILLMHLKKQLGRKRTRFVLLASPPQANTAILKQYHGWLDTSAEDGALLAELQRLLHTLLSKPKKHEERSVVETFVPPAPPAILEPATLSNNDFELPVAPPPVVEPTLEEQGITYSPRQRLNVYSEFTSSFDSAVSSAPEAEPLEQISPAVSHDRHTKSNAAELKPTPSNRFMFWLVPVIIVVIAITYLQQKKPAGKAEPTVAKPLPSAPAKPGIQSPPPSSAPVTVKPAADSAKTATSPRAAASVVPHDQMSDTAVLTAIAEKRSSKSPSAVASSGAGLANLPDFIPRYGFDKQYGAANPGWERYKGKVTEFKVLRETEKIKAIQVIDRGGNGIPESFMKAVVRQSAKNPLVSITSSEKKDGYEVQRGRLADNISVVYYRDEVGGRLRAMVLTWH